MRTSLRPASSACRLALAAKALQVGVSGRPGTQPQRYAPHQAAASACDRNSGRAGIDHQPIPGRASGAGSENTICWTNNASNPSKASGIPTHLSRVGPATGGTARIWARPVAAYAEAAACWGAYRCGWVPGLPETPTWSAFAANANRQADEAGRSDVRIHGPQRLATTLERVLRALPSVSPAA